MIQVLRKKDYRCKRLADWRKQQAITTQRSDTGATVCVSDAGGRHRNRCIPGAVVTADHEQRWPGSAMQMPCLSSSKCALTHCRNNSNHVRRTGGDDSASTRAASPSDHQRCVGVLKRIADHGNSRRACRTPNGSRANSYGCLCESLVGQAGWPSVNHRWVCAASCWRRFNREPDQQHHRLPRSLGPNGGRQHQGEPQQPTREPQSSSSGLNGHHRFHSRRSASASLGTAREARVLEVALAAQVIDTEKDGRRRRVPIMITSVVRSVPASDTRAQPSGRSHEGSGVEQRPSRRPKQAVGSRRPTGKQTPWRHSLVNQPAGKPPAATVSKSRQLRRGYQLPWPARSR